jgi:hypothetical protein
MYWDTPSGNIVLVIVSEYHNVPEVHDMKQEIYVSIDDVEKLFKDTNDFLNWYHSAGVKDE